MNRQARGRRPESVASSSAGHGRADADAGARAGAGAAAARVPHSPATAAEHAGAVDGPGAKRRRAAEGNLPGQHAVGVAGIFDEDGTALPHAFVAPDTPEFGPFMTNTFSLYAAGRAPPGATFRVVFTGTVNGTPFEREWSFTCVDD